MNANSTIDAADIVTLTAYGYATYGGKTVSVTTMTRSQGNDSAVVSIARQSVDGLESWSTDLAGLTTHTKLERLGNGATRQTVTNPDGTKVITNMTNGKVTSVQQVNSDDSLGNLNTYSYDEFNRVIGVTETNDQTTVNTTASTYNANGAVLTQTENGQTTSYVYDSMGRQANKTLRLSVGSIFPKGHGKISFYRYQLDGHRLQTANRAEAVRKAGTLLPVIKANSTEVAARVRQANGLSIPLRDLPLDGV